MHLTNSPRWGEQCHDVANVFVAMELREEGDVEFAKTRWPRLILIDKASVHDNTMLPSPQGKINKPNKSHILTIMIVALESESES